jgi:N-acetylmuramoyl-L-alanine amidase
MNSESRFSMRRTGGDNRALRGRPLLTLIPLLVAGVLIWHPLGVPSLLLYAQGSPPPSPLTLITRDARRTIPTTVVGGQELIALDDVAALFQVVLRDDPLAGGVTLTYRGRTVVASADQPMASVNGRVVTLPSPVVRSGSRWLVPVEFLPRALGPIYDQRIELRRPQRLLLVGDVRVPRVTARVESTGAPTRVTIDVAPQAGVTAATEAGRVVLRIDADYLDTALPAAAGGQVDQIRRGDVPNTIAVVLAGTAGTPRVTQTTADGAARVTIEVPPAGQAAVSPDTAAPPRPAASAPDATIATPRVPFQTMVIDPGHGGDDVGVKGAGGLEEKSVTLDVARRLRGLIEARLGMRVVLTRDDDRFVPLDARAAIANNSKADLFLSLHVNSSLSSASNGAEVYHLKLDREGEEVRRQAAADAVTLPVLGGGTRTLDVIRWDLAQARHVSESARLASLILEQLNQRVTVSPRGIQQAPLRVLEGADTPAALIEMFYLSNPAQEKAAATEEFKNALAQALFDAVARFRVTSGDANPR